MAERRTPNIYLNNRQRTRQFLARVITEIYNGTIEVTRGRAVVHGCSILLQQFNVEEQEKQNEILVKLAKMHNIEVMGDVEEAVEDGVPEVNYQIKQGT